MGRLHVVKIPKEASATCIYLAVVVVCWGGGGKRVINRFHRPTVIGCWAVLILDLYFPYVTSVNGPKMAFRLQFFFFLAADYFQY